MCAVHAEHRVALGTLTAITLLAAAGAQANPFAHEDPRWQISLTPSYTVLVGYDGKTRRGGGVDACALVQLTTAFSIALESGYFTAQRRAQDSGITHAVRFKLMVRYDLDVIQFRPYLAAGATAVVFEQGVMEDAEDWSSPSGVKVGMNLGPVIEGGLDWRPIRWLVVGIVLDMAWLMRFTPARDTPWPSVRTAGVRLGIYF